MSSGSLIKNARVEFVKVKLKIKPSESLIFIIVTSKRNIYPETIFFSSTGCRKSIKKKNNTLKQLAYCINTFHAVLKIRGTSKSINQDRRHSRCRRSLVSWWQAPPPQPVASDETARSVILTSALRCRQHLSPLLSFRDTPSAGIFVPNQLLRSLMSWT